MALRSCIIRQTCYVNTPVNLAGELDELAGTQSPVKRSNAGSNKAPTKTLSLLETSTLPLILPTSEDLFTKFMKVFMEITQAQAQALIEP